MGKVIPINLYELWTGKPPEAEHSVKCSQCQRRMPWGELTGHHAGNHKAYWKGVSAELKRLDAKAESLAGVVEAFEESGEPTVHVTVWPRG